MITEWYFVSFLFIFVVGKQIAIQDEEGKSFDTEICSYQFLETLVMGGIYFNILDTSLTMISHYLCIWPTGL